jgi:ketosteroid isomerase-like protein
MSTQSSTKDGSAEDAVIDRFYDALSSGDIAAARACCTDDVRMWHSHDGIEQDLDQLAQVWTQFVAVFPKRVFTDVRRSPTRNGYVQQHLLIVHTADGQKMAWPACILVKIRDGRIARVDEYIHLGGSLPVVDDNMLTPGLPRD